MALKKKLRIDKLQKVRKHLSSKRDRARKNIAVLVDGPNMLRKEFQINLEEIRDMLKDFGDVKVGKVFLNQYASEKLVEAVENQGFEPIVTSGDVDVRLAVEAMELVYNDSVDVIALVTRDADFKPILNKAMEIGKETIVFGAEPGLASALKNSADYVIVLNQEDFEYVEQVDEGEEVYQG